MLFIKSKIQFFESKSQLIIGYKQKFPVVYQVKDTIFWKQITTIIDSARWRLLLFIKSKIQFFESKSQRLARMKNKCLSCLSSQRYNFLKANHNEQGRIYYFDYVVYQVKDTIFWKQITTQNYLPIVCKMLFIKSKIQFFESKSQPMLHSLETCTCCLSSQRYNFLKANHNLREAIRKTINVVYQVKDTIFWKQITTRTFPYSADTSCLSSQRYNFLKANHNTEKRAQLYGEVVYQVKDTIFWKQITTTDAIRYFQNRLFIKSKIQFFESKSQLVVEVPTENIVVYQVKDTIFWKQITTRK